MNKEKHEHMLFIWSTSEHNSHEDLICRFYKDENNSECLNTVSLLMITRLVEFCLPLLLLKLIPFRKVYYYFVGSL